MKPHQSPTRTSNVNEAHTLNQLQDAIQRLEDIQLFGDDVTGTDLEIIITNLLSVRDELEQQLS